MLIWNFAQFLDTSTSNERPARHQPDSTQSLGDNASVSEMTQPTAVLRALTVRVCRGGVHPVHVVVAPDQLHIAAIVIECFQLPRHNASDTVWKKRGAGQSS